MVVDVPAQNLHALEEAVKGLALVDGDFNDIALDGRVILKASQVRGVVSRFSREPLARVLRPWSTKSCTSVLRAN